MTVNDADLIPAPLRDRSRVFHIPKLTVVDAVAYFDRLMAHILSGREHDQWRDFIASICARSAGISLRQIGQLAGAQAAPSAVTYDPEEYSAENVFWMPDTARRDHLAANAKVADIGVQVDDAMREVERVNDTLKDALPKVYGRAELSRDIVAGLIELFTNDLTLSGSSEDFDLIGRVYEYFIGEFASNEDKRGGEFYTPESIVSVLVEMLEPTSGRVYDPCCGTGRFFVQSEKFIHAHRGRVDDIAVYGQKSNPTTYKLARINLALRRILGNIAWNHEGMLVRDAVPDERFEFILANPSFNVSDWERERLRVDNRWRFGTAPVGNANFAWLSHIHHHLSANGIAGVVLANRSMSSMQSGEGDIRKSMVQNGAVDAMVALPAQLFFGTQIPACLWILAKDKSNGHAAGRTLRDRRGEVLFIDARKMGMLVSGSRKQKELSVDEIAKIADTYHASRGETPDAPYADEASFCASASVEEIETHDFVRTPGRYVGAGAVEDDGEVFEKKFSRLMGELRRHFTEGRRLNGYSSSVIQARLTAFWFPVPVGIDLIAAQNYPLHQAGLRARFVTVHSSPTVAREAIDTLKTQSP